MSATALRVLHVCQTDDVRIGGALSVARALVAEQLQAGVDARLLTLYSRPDGAITPAERLPLLGCNVRRSSRWWRGPFVLRKHLRAFHPDIIHHHDGLLWPLLATATTGVPLVAHAHVGWTTGYRRISAPLAQRAIGRLAARLFAVSEWVADSWRAAGTRADKVRVVWNGVDIRRFRPRGPDEKARLRRALNLRKDVPVVLWAGRMHRASKGLDRLLAVAAALPPTSSLVVLGDGPERCWFESALAGRARCAVKLFGAVADPSPYFAAADSYVFTSVVESFGLVLLEAAASGLPVVAFNCHGGAQEVFRFIRATVFSETEPEKLARAALHSGLTTQTHQVAQLVHRESSWSRISGLVMSNYNELLAGRSLRRRSGNGYLPVVARNRPAPHA